LSAFYNIDFNTNEGAKLGRALVERLDELRSRLEDVALSERDTQAARGAISEIKRMLNRPIVKVTSVPSYSSPGGVNHA